MSQEWDGHERRQGWPEMSMSLAMIQKDVSYIREGIELEHKRLSNHIEEDIIVHQKVERQGVSITMLMTLTALVIGALISMALKK